MKITSYLRALKKKQMKNIVMTKGKETVRCQERYNNNQQLVITFPKETCNID